MSDTGLVGGAIPTGMVTFLFTDVERSTRMWEDHPEAMQAALGRHDQIVRREIEGNEGYVFSLAGDQFVAAFQQAADALSAAAAIQNSIEEEAWPDATPIKVRIGLHIGEAEERDRDYFGQVLNRTARIVAVGHGGQTLVSGAVAVQLDRDDLIDLGEHQLKDLVETEHLWQFGAGEFSPLRSLTVARHNLPVERTALLGREDAVASIAESVAQNRLVSLLGIGGTGKTRLATAVAAEVANNFSHGVWFVDLVPATDTRSMAEAIASATGLRLTGSDLVAALVAQATDRQMLLVIDNCEHITDDAAEVIDRLLERCEALHILATSREPLDLDDEYQIQIAPLAVADDAGSPAVQLFTAAAERVGVEIAASEIPAVAQICRQLDGLPLSVELAAAQLRQLRLSELADRLDKRFELLTRGRRSRRRRHASLLEVLDDSWSLLEQAEQELMMYLAAFPSTFLLADIEAVASVGNVGVVSETLGSLVDRGMVAGGGSDGNRLLETVKLFVRQKWAGEDVPDRYLQAHTDWLFDQLRSHDDAARYQSVQLAAWAMTHYDDHRAVEDRLVAAGETHQLGELIGALLFAYSRETGQRASALIERVEHYLEELQLGTADQAALQLTAAAAGRPARRADWLTTGAAEAVAKFRLVDDPVSLAVALIVATFSKVLRDPVEAFANLDEAQTIAEDAGVDSLFDIVLAYRAHYAAMNGQIGTVHDLVAELETRAQNHSLDNVRMMTLQAKVVANMLSAPEVAKNAASEYLSQATRHGLDNDWWVHLYLATATAAAGESAEMDLHLEDARALLTRSGSAGLPDILLPYIALAQVVGEVELAQRWVTAMRHADERPGTGVVIAMYRQLRGAVGLASYNPLDEMSLGEIYDEARRWATEGTVA